jgi:Predicted acetyltransferase
MNLQSLIVPELPVHAGLVEKVHTHVFGPGAHARAAFRLREQGPHDLNVSFVAVNDGDLIGSVRMTPIVCNEGHRGFLLGPLAVSPSWQNVGLGKALVARAVSAAEADGVARFVLLVGDAPYYAPLGFDVCAPGHLSLPGPVNPRRLLVHPLGDFDAANIKGRIKHAKR